MRSHKLTRPRQFVIASFIVGFCLMLFACPKKNQTQKENDVLSKLPISIAQPLSNQVYRTPKGATVSVINPIPVEKQAKVLDLVDKGLDDLFISTASLGYPTWNAYTDFYIMMRPPMMRSGITGCPLLAMKDGTTIAGTVVSFFGVLIEPPLIVVPENYDESEVCNNLLSDGVRFEGEHIKARYGNINLFYATTGAGDIHPIYQLPAIVGKRERDDFIREVETAARHADFDCDVKSALSPQTEPREVINWKSLMTLETK